MRSNIPEPMINTVGQAVPARGTVGVTLGVGLGELPGAALQTQSLSVRHAGTRQTPDDCPDWM